MQFPELFDPLVAEWFTSRFNGATEPQNQGWAQIAAGRDVLISAPTGSGKTLAAFLICIDRLVRAARAGTLDDRTSVLYISPLKALSNDVQRNLERPLAEIATLAAQRGLPLQTIRTALRTGDTPQRERQRVIQQPPHILVTTPESLFILLTAAKSREMLRSVTTVIVDEIHAIADDKRGSHLALSLARLESVTANRPRKIGLSATVNPIQEVANFLSPGAAIVNTGHRRDMRIEVEIPNDELGAVASTELWAETYDRIAAHILRERTTLIFVNTRRLAERVSHALSERIGKDKVLPHHGSLARTLRLEAEARLKAGDLRAVVATASLELGIDIGTVDLVIQVGTPRSISVSLQRIGRSGHWVGAQPRGILLPTTRDELIECAAVIHGIRSGSLEKLEIPENALDILAQQLVAETAAEPWSTEALFAQVRSAYPYRNLTRPTFNEVVEMMSEGIATSRGRAGTLLHYDRVNHRLRGRRGARLAAITCGGAIPDNAYYQVIAEPEGKVIGTVDEDFAVEATVGSTFLLGTHSWRVRRVETGRVRVEDAHGSAPNVPFWLGEGPGRSPELSQAVSEVRQQIQDQGDIAGHWLLEHCGLDAAAACQAVAYVRAAAASLGALPTVNTVVAERFFDEGGGMQLIIHAPFGSRINRAWGLALRKKFCRTFNFELQAAATDNGICISLSDQHAFPLELVFEFLKPETLEDTLTQAMLPAPVFGARWRWNATRSLAILRFRNGKKLPPNLLRMRSDDLLASVFPDQAACGENLTGPIRIPDHPLVNETISNCLHEAMDLNGLRSILQRMQSGAIRKVAIDTAEPSFFAHEILNANPYAFLDDAPLEERRTRAVQMRRSLPTELLEGAGILDAAAIRTVANESWPEPRDPDELHDALLTLIALPPVEAWRPWFDDLALDHRAFTLIRNGQQFWTAAERTDVAQDPLAVLRGWMESTGPSTATALSAKLAFATDEIEIALTQLEGQGQVLRGRFSQLATQQVEWCNRRVLARIHRLTLGRLRREVEPVPAQLFHTFLSTWQHAVPGKQLHGVDGVLQIVRQLQGYEIPAAAWESQILAARIGNYDSTWLDQLCLSGEVMWGRLSESSGAKPTRIAPVSLFLREDSDWLLCARPIEGAGAVLEALQKERALFFQDLIRITKLTAAQVQESLWELAGAGIVTADGFDNLRSLMQGRREAKRHTAGRWALMPRAESHPQRVEKWAEQLLLRWGILMRDLLAREACAPPWRDLLPVLRTLEARGQIRGGRFVSGFTGEQFALPEAVDLLRALRREGAAAERTPANADPLNLTGIILPGPRISPRALTEANAPHVPGNRDVSIGPQHPHLSRTS